MLWDVFISHASEDKDDVARPLADLLHGMGLRVWLDEQQLGLGDSLSRKINDGLALSRFGVLVLSTSFLEKDYPQREMQALLARQTASERYILPILHKVEHSLLLRRAPLLGDLLSVSTDDGLQQVAAAIQRAVAGMPLATPTVTAVRYFEHFEFPGGLVSACIAAIGSLHEPSTWNSLEPRRNMALDDIWMGSDADELVVLLYRIYAPLVHFANHRYRLQRTLTTLSLCDRVRFDLLDSALEALTRDASIAAASPRLPYDPRVSGWRQLREAEPAKYWWQGLTLERIQSAVPTFYDSNRLESQPSLGAFREAYAVGYRAFGGGQQTLGLLANPLYGFTAASRPVYWRLLALWHTLYTMVVQLPEDATSSQLQRIFLNAPWIDAAFPEYHLADDLLPEANGCTKGAVVAYCKSYVNNRLRESLA
ncbi:MAG TPA: toll/interleukin-1 receptor domain-containing protein [Thermoanaerobaculia bacterium]|nr:toll/interleukin-1 receptor domain-containing protein [Thermoanaerobaculia bacterium]